MSKKIRPQLREPYSWLGTCTYCKRPITREDWKKDRVKGVTTVNHSGGWSIGARTRKAHLRCYLKAMLGVKHYRKHLND